MSKVLLIWNANWADEMDIEGFSLYDKEEWEIYKKKLKTKKRFGIYIGSNEEIGYESGEDLLEEITVKKITPDEEKTIKKFFKDGFGHLEFLEVYPDDEEEDEEYYEEQEDDLVI
jgi:hypothetical protein